MAGAGNSYRKGWFSTVDLLVLTSLDKHLLLITYLTFLRSKYLNEEDNGTEPSPLVSVPCFCSDLARKN